MAKSNKKLGKQAQEIISSNLAPDQPTIMPQLRAARDEYCELCKVKSVNFGGTANLKRCSECELVYYCSRACHADDWSKHRTLCKDRSQQKVLSMIQLMAIGTRIFCDGSGKKLAQFEKVAIQPAPELFSPNAPVSTLCVKVSSADRSFSIPVTAFFSVATRASSISERLANCLDLTRGGKIFVSGLVIGDLEAYLPSKSVDIVCLHSVRAGSPSVIPSFSRMALVILPNPGKDLVLGRDWMEDMSRQSGRELLLDYAPDKCRVRFLATGQEVESVEEGDLMDLSAYLHHPSAGNYVVAEWAWPDPGPAYDPSVADCSHLIRPDFSAQEQLARVAAALVKGSQKPM
jgi:hypothetical protein